MLVLLRLTVVRLLFQFMCAEMHARVQHVHVSRDLALGFPDRYTTVLTPGLGWRGNVAVCRSAAGARAETSGM